jgi:hypothetical protein
VAGNLLYACVRVAGWWPDLNAGQLWGNEPTIHNDLTSGTRLSVAMKPLFTVYFGDSQSDVFKQEIEPLKERSQA